MGVLFVLLLLGSTAAVSAEPALRLEWIKNSGLDLAGGIHEALFTTVYGLMLALIAWGFTYAVEALARRHLRQLEILVFHELEVGADTAADASVVIGPDKVTTGKN